MKNIYAVGIAGGIVLLNAGITFATLSNTIRVVPEKVIEQASPTPMPEDNSLDGGPGIAPVVDPADPTSTPSPAPVPTSTATPVVVQGAATPVVDPTPELTVEMSNSEFTQYLMKRAADALANDSRVDDYDAVKLTDQEHKAYFKAFCGPIADDYRDDMFMLMAKCKFAPQVAEKIYQAGYFIDGKRVVLTDGSWYRK